MDILKERRLEGLAVATGGSQLLAAQLYRLHWLHAFCFVKSHIKFVDIELYSFRTSPCEAEGFGSVRSGKVLQNLPTLGWTIIVPLVVGPLMTIPVS